MKPTISASVSWEIFGATRIGLSFLPTEHRDDRFFAGLRKRGQLHRARLDVHDVRARVALREDRLAPRVLHDCLGSAGRFEKCVCVERSYGLAGRRGFLRSTHPA
jgi:hypothetical protein